LIEVDKLKEEFIKSGGILKTSELNSLGLSSRQIKRFVDCDIITRIKRGYYEFHEGIIHEEVIISKLFPKAVIFLESSLMYYEYTDRIPTAWQIAVDKNSNKNKYDINYPLIEAFYLEPKFLELGVDEIYIDNVKIRIYDRDRTICDILRYEKKLEKEVFNNAVQRYIKDPKKNLRNLFEYADILNIKNKTQTYIGVWI
jgi:predicted transcriptional regulator of viral defense system